MLEHHIQKDILLKLIKSPSARYSELKPKTVDGNIFTYHLHQLIKNKYIEKCEDGTYQLTANGKAIGINSELSHKELLEQAHAILLIAVRKDNAWLMRKRLAHPAYGMTGFVHTEPVLGEKIADTASRVLLERTGITATCTPKGSGYIRMLRDGELESFTQFTLLTAAEPTGTLIQTKPTGENVWVEDPDFSDISMVPSMQDLIQRLESPEFFFAELEYHI